MSQQSKHQKELGAESEATIRDLSSGWLGQTVYWLSVAVALFHIWANTFGLMSELWRNALHMLIFTHKAGNQDLG